MLAYSGVDRRELKIELQKDITTYLFRSLPLCIVLAHNEFLNWYYSHFLNIVSWESNSGFIGIDYCERRIPYTDIAEHKSLGYRAAEVSEIVDITEYTRQRIDEGYYLIIYLDEYFISGKAKTQKEHFIHESLIYGYENVNSSFMAVSFNEKRTFARMNFRYDEFVEAFLSARNSSQNLAPDVQAAAIQLIKPCNLKAYEFDLNNFLNSLKSYIFSMPGTCKLYDEVYSGSNIQYGFQVYSTITSKLERLAAGEMLIDYKAIHLICEHKERMADRLGWVISRYNAGGRLTGMYKRYCMLVEEFKVIRMLFMKALTYRDKDIAFRNISLIERILKIIKGSMQDEVELLKEIYKGLEIICDSGIFYKAGEL